MNSWSVWEYTEYQTIPSRVDGLAERPINKEFSTGMTENDDIKHNLMLNIKRLEGILERIDKYCHNYDQEKVDASVAVLKIKSSIENLREIIPEMSRDAESIDQETDKLEEEEKD